MLRSLKQQIVAGILLFPFIATAQINNGSAVFSAGTTHQVNMTTGSVSTTSGLQSSTYDCGSGMYSFFACTTKALTQNGDLISNPRLSTCACPCLNQVSLGSVRPFWKAKKTFYSMNLTMPLNLNDTSSFVKIDTIKKCDTATTCWLPAVTISLGAPESVLVVQTAAKTAALVRVKQIDTTIQDILDCSYQGGYSTYILRISLQWYLQINGTLDFSSVSQQGVLQSSLSMNPIHRNAGYRIGFAQTLTNRPYGKFYTITGKSISSRELKKVTGLVIYR